MWEIFSEPMLTVIVGVSGFIICFFILIAVMLVIALLLDLFQKGYRKIRRLKRIHDRG